MCIRDSFAAKIYIGIIGDDFAVPIDLVDDCSCGNAFLYVCLLYTSDAADERSSVDLGGRRIIKKKKKCNCKVVYTSELTKTLNRLKILQHYQKMYRE
mgnify:CR=1 FL=1